MDISNTSARNLLNALRDRDLSAVELMDATYDAIAAWNPHVNALVSLLDRDAALALAREADAAEPRGPLHGLPLAVKDLNDVAGFVTTKGSPALAGNPPATRDGVLAGRMRAAGALMIGKTNVPAFAMGSHTTNPVFGTTHNPWALDRTAGGSSGGASVALATGMLALADGSDMMGSLRNPAGWANVYGLRPSFGAVPMEAGGDTFNAQLSTAGPMARSPEDLALFLSAISGPVPHQPHGRALPSARPDGPRRIGWLGDWGGAFPMEPGILALCREALAVFEDLGHTVIDMAPPFSRDALWDSWTTLRAAQMAGSLAPVAAAHGIEVLGHNAAYELEQGRSLTAMQLHAASVTRSDWFARAAELFETCDVLVLPTAQCWPFDGAMDYPREIDGVAMDTYHRWMEVMIPASLIGLPALGIPAGFAGPGPFAGLPMGLQLIGPRGADNDLLALGQPFHEAAGWTGLRPALPTPS